MLVPKGKLGVCFDIPTASVTEAHGMIHDAGSFPWLQRGQSDKDRAGGRIRQLPRATEVSGGGKEGGASEDGDQEVATESVRRSVVSDSLRPRGLEPTRLLCPWNSPGKNTAVGCHFLSRGPS